MATTYAAYSNVMHGNKAQKQQESARSSVSSAGSTQKASTWHRFVDQLKPLEQPLPPVGIYGPIPGDHPARKASIEKAAAKKESGVKSAYEKFKVFVGGEKVYLSSL